MKVYITRNKNSDDNLDNLIFIWLKKPEKREGEGCFVDGDKNFIEYGSIRPNSYGSFLFKRNISSFKRMFGYVPKKGSCEVKELVLK